MEKACDEFGIKPLYGCEFYCVPNLQDNHQRKDHLTIIARNQKGLQNIMALVSLAWTEGNFYYKPTIDYRLLAEYGEGLLISSGCMFGRYSQLVWKYEDEDKAYRTAQWFASKFPGAYFLEVQAFDFKESKATAEVAIAHAHDLGIPAILTTDAHYPGPTDKAARELLLRVTPGWTPGNSDVPLWQWSRKEAFQQMRSVWPKASKQIMSELMDNTIAAADLCDHVRLHRAEPVKWIPASKKVTANDDFDISIKIGWERRGFANLDRGQRAIYKARLNRERTLIRDKGFVDYLMVVADVIMWAKRHGIVVGPARGSSSGSLVCFILGITEIDPIKFGLLFERFIDINRMDPPDIDTDFEDKRRDEIHSYLRDKYGADHFAALCTFAQYKPKNALDDIARAFHIPKEPVEKLKGFVIERSSADARTSNCFEDTVAAFPAAREIVDRYPDLGKAMLIEGQYRQPGRHACGVIIGQQPLTDYTAIMRSNDGTPQIVFEGGDAADIGLLKIDILGLRSLTIIATVLERIGKDVEWLYGLPLDDKDTYKGFQRGDLTGVFQFTGQSTMSVCKQMPPKHFMELSDINALSRPGPLHSGSTTIYIGARNGERAPLSYHPEYDRITRDTYGIIVYQEQIMEVGRQLAGLSWEEVSALRKIISKKLGVEGFNKHKKAFVDGAFNTSGVEKEAAEEIWDNICTHGSWSFNKSHSVAYALISYMMMYLKVHYPLEFHWANMVDLTDQTKKVYLVRDYMREGGHILPVHLNHSAAQWEIDVAEQGLRPGFIEIKGIGPKAADELARCQPYENEADLRAKCSTRAVNAGTVKALIARGLLTENGDIGEGDNDVFGLRRLKDTIDNLPVTHRIMDLGWGKEHWCIVAGRVIEKNVRDLFEVEYSKRGRVLDPNEVYRPELAAFINLTIEDHTDSIYATYDRFIYPEVRDIIFNEKNQPDDIFLIHGTKTKGFRKVYAKRIVNVSLQQREELEEDYG
jgi:DNA polymerase-3 subunit alpha